MEQTDKKVKVSQDFLYERLKEHNMTISMIARKMGMSESVVRNSFRHNLNRHGNPLKFNAVSIGRLNDALQLIATELREGLITFGTDQMFTNQRGTTYDPGTLEAIHRIGGYFNMKALTERLLGWKKVKCDITLSVKSSPMYGRITRDDVDRINAEVLAVAGMLEGFEVEMPTEIDVAAKDKDTRKRMEQTFESQAQPWDDTSLSLPERSRLLRERWPQGVLLFRVNGGYTAEGDDARMLSEIDAGIAPYTDPTTGMTTAYMDADQMAAILPRLVADGRRVMMTDMYKDKE